MDDDVGTSCSGEDRPDPGSWDDPAIRDKPYSDEAAPADTCPRRMTELGPWERTAGLDPVRSGRCPFCGSLAPAEFMRRARQGDELGPTDKSYKVYLDDPWAKFYFQHLDEAQRQEFFELYRDGKLNLGYPGRFYVLPFFITTAAAGPSS